MKTFLREIKRSIFVIIVLFILVNFASFVLADNIPAIPNSKEWVNSIRFPVVEIAEDPRDMDPEGSGRRTNDKKVDYLADTWNRQNRGFQISGSYNVNEMTNSSYVIWTISFNYEIPFNIYDSNKTNKDVRNINDAIIGEVIVSTFNAIEPTAIVVNEMNWVVADAEGLDKNPAFWIMKYQIRRKCLEATFAAEDYTVWKSCAIGKEGEIIFVDE